MREFVRKILSHRFFYIGLSAFSLIIVKYFHKENNNKIKSITNKEPISVKELVENNNRYNNKEVLVLGKIRSEQESSYIINKNTPFSIFDYYNNYKLNVEKYNFDVENFRNGTIENLSLLSNVIISFFENLLRKLTRNEINLNDLDKPYLINDDQVSILGTYHKSSIYPSIISQGNKQNLIQCLKSKSKIYAETETILYGFILVSAIREAVLFINIMIIKWRNRKYLKKSTKSNQKISENCSKCKNSYVNVVQLDCNHFSFCFGCFQLLNNVCPLCNTEIHNYYVLKDK